MLYSSSILSPVSSDCKIQGQEPCLFYSTVNYLAFSTGTNTYLGVCVWNEEWLVSMKTFYDDNFVTDDYLNSYQTVKTIKSV